MHTTESSLEKKKAMIATSTIQAYKDNTKRGKKDRICLFVSFFTCKNTQISCFFCFPFSLFFKPCLSVRLCLHSPPAPKIKML